jgi:hypothetical protein
MDDNIDAFHYLNRDHELEVRTGATLARSWRVLSLARSSNVPVSGLNYYSFCKKNDAVPPYILNTRIYSWSAEVEQRCWLLAARGRYTEGYTDPKS